MRFRPVILLVTVPLPLLAVDVVAASAAVPAIGAGLSGVADASGRPYATAAARHLARAAKTPW